LSATIEVVDTAERLLGTGRFTTDKAGYAAMRSFVKSWPHRVWAVEGANGAGCPLAQRLVEAGEQVVDVPERHRQLRRAPRRLLLGAVGARVHRGRNADAVPDDSGRLPVPLAVRVIHPGEPRAPTALVFGIVSWLARARENGATGTRRA
jgi:hypothetical protein